MRQSRGKVHPHVAAEAQGDRPVVFWLVSDSSCAECGQDLGKGRFLRLEGGRPLCLACADMDHLVFQPSGDAALTRRATKYSTLSAVVVRFSRARKRYERQGVLVEPEALERAENECLADADARERARERSAERRAQLEAKYVQAFAGAIREQYSRCPVAERRSIAEHACLKYSGRIGRSAAARELDREAVELAVRAHVRHEHTAYDELLMRGLERGEARAAIARAVEEVLETWRGK